MYRHPDEPASELREALDAATGRDRTASGDAVSAAALEAGGTGARRTGSWLRPFLGSTLANAAGTILAAIAIAIVSYLFAHHPGHAPARQQPPARPSATAVHS